MQHAPIEVVPLGVDVDVFASAEPIALADAPPPRIGFLGRLEPVKGLDVLLEAFDRLSAPATLVIAGDGSECARIEAAAMKRDRVRVLPPIAFEHVPSFLRAMDLIVLPSVTIPPLHREQFGRALVEAMAAGVPVIGSDSGGIPETIGDAGIVVPERDSHALAAAIERVLADAVLRQALIERGRLRVRGRYAWSEVAGLTERLFRSAIVHRRRARTRLEELRA
jgi:glycosyltransferase involved in cell wall biosynthesis